MSVSAEPKIYHIVHIDRLDSIVRKGFLWSDAEVAKRRLAGTTIGMSDIKQRRLKELTLKSHQKLLVGNCVPSELFVGDCVPFYFCPRSIMLYVLHHKNYPELSYRGGQEPVIHLKADLRQTVAWAKRKNLRWAFTCSNAGSRYFEDYCDLAHLNKIDWNAVYALYWENCQEYKQAEFLIEKQFPWELVSCIGVCTPEVKTQAENILIRASHKPPIKVMKKWYY